MVRERSRFLSLFGVLTAVFFVMAGGAHAGSSCPGDDNNDKQVTVDELVSAVNAALKECPSRAGCGDGVVQAALGEQCDGTELSGESCASVGFGGGTLACNVACEFDTRGCAAPTGGRLLETGQTECDQGDGTLGACPGSPAEQDGAVLAGVPLNYTDNGDGTITDNVTGLMWEKLSDDDSIHDLDNVYTWQNAFDVKVAELNKAPGFANQTDWRLPNRREVESIVDAGRAGPAADPVFQTGCVPGCKVTQCSCTQKLQLQYDYTWTSTTYQKLPSFAWAVNFDVGDVSFGEKAELRLGVRAVRGGL